MRTIRTARRWCRGGVGWSALLLAGWFSLGTPPASGAAAPAAPDACMACHTDAAKLKTLAPPDPPPTEAGEG